MHLSREYLQTYQERLQRTTDLAKRCNRTPAVIRLAEFMESTGRVHAWLHRQAPLEPAEASFLPGYAHSSLAAHIEQIENDAQLGRQQKNLQLVDECLYHRLFFHDNYGIALLGEEGLFETIDKGLARQAPEYTAKSVLDLHPSSDLGKFIQREYRMKSGWRAAVEDGTWDGLAEHSRTALLDELDMQGSVTFRTIRYEKVPSHIVVVSCHGNPLGISKAAMFFGEYARRWGLGIHFDAYIKPSQEWAGVLHLPGLHE